MLQPKVGDTVILKAVVDSLSGDTETMKVSFIECAIPDSRFVRSGRVHAILPREPQAGDTVWYPGSPWDGGNLLHIHQGEGDSRKWATVAFKGDIPQSIPFDTVRLER